MALETPVPVQDSGDFEDRMPEAAGYKIELKRGQKLTTRVTRKANNTSTLFPDLFRREGKENAPVEFASFSLHRYKKPGERSRKRVTAC